MVHALTGLNAAGGKALKHLDLVTFGGSTLTPETLRMSVNELGSKAVENAFGSTEGFLVRSFSQADISKLLDGEEVSVGWVMPGSGLRIADPDTNEILPLNTPGELQGSAPLVTRYIGGIGQDSFYNDPDGREWFKTGDQARMDETGRVFVTGRYKEM
jgi:acyl-CoA synthetase (AMP-forming)/AMP-acid ligase II